MVTFFLICAVVGGTVLVCQFLLTLIGLGGDHEVGGDHGEGDFSGGDHDVVDGDHDASGATDTETADHHGGDDGHASSYLFGVLTFRTLTAAVAFFGLTGLAADSAGWPTASTLLAAVVSGGVAITIVHHLMKLFTRLRSDGTVRLSAAVGMEARVYLKIPAARHGQGKIHVQLKQQTVELLAETDGAELKTGSAVRVLGFIGPEVVIVEPLEITSPAMHEAVADSVPV